MKLIVSDLDGTLLNSKHEISKQNIRALRAAKENGYEIAIATGRIYTDVLNILKRLKSMHI
ncbi:HAD family hydrolase [Caloramator sp. mosi_1]|uniref:HAD family hydrolase n=1 Tax=Caloramator sp. mosi_1 TaxID=3023090 RepID=UPI003081E33E